MTDIYSDEKEYDSYFQPPNRQEGIDNFIDNNLTNPSSQSGFGKIIPEFISSTGNDLLNIDNRPINQSTHNNFMPFYGAKLTQNMRGTDVPQAGDNNASEHRAGFANETPFRQKLSDFTGCDKEYMHKRETGPYFSPTEGITSWVFGTPAIRPDMDRYKTSIWKRNGETPVEKIQVGPGIGLDYTVPAEGGFQQFNRIMPNNVSDYKANQLENRINAGKWHVNHPTSQYTEGVSQNKPDLITTQARRPTMKGGFYVQAPSSSSSRLTDYNVSSNKGRQNREDTEKSGGYGQLVENRGIENFEGGNSDSDYCVKFGQAPVGMVMGSNVPRQSQERDKYNTIRTTFKKGKFNVKSGKIEECLEDSQGANDWGLIMGPAGQSKGGVNREGYYSNFTERGDANPYVINPSGNVKWNPNSFQQDARTTTKETGLYNYQGNPGGSVKKQTSDSWEDTARVTRKETTAYSYQGSAAGSGRFTDRFQFTGN